MNEGRDQIAGRNVAAMRGDMSQAALAERMRDRGWRWSQATVWATERGDRPLRLLEAVDLVQILGFESPLGADAVLLRHEEAVRVQLAGNEVRDRARDVEAAVLSLRHAQEALAMAAEVARSRGVELDLHANVAIETGLSPEILDHAVADADRRWLRLDPDEDNAPDPRAHFSDLSRYAPPTTSIGGDHAE